MNTARITWQMGAPQAKQLRELTHAEMVRRGWTEDAEAEDVMAEYAVVMVINGKNEDQIMTDLSEIITDVDVDFIRWLFKQAESLNPPQSSSTKPETAEPSTQSKPTTARRSSPSSPNFNGTPGSLKRAASRSPSPSAAKIPRTSDAPTGPRAWRNGANGSANATPPTVPNPRSLLERVGPPSRAQLDSVQARIDRITGAGAVPSPPQQSWPQQVNGGMGGGGMGMGGRMNNSMSQHQFDEMMGMQMAMMQLMALMTNGGMMANGGGGMGGMGFMPGQMGGIGMNMGMGAYDRGRFHKGRGRGMGRGGRNWRDDDFLENVAVLNPVDDGPVIEEPGSPAETVITIDTVPLMVHAASRAAAAEPRGSGPRPPTVSVAPKSGEPLTLCKFGVKCTNPACRFAHPSPASTELNGIVISNDPCPAGTGCKDPDCTMVHPSPATAAAVAKPAKPYVHTKPFVTTTLASAPAQAHTEIMCKFGGNCTRPGCYFAHPWDKKERPCRFGAGCTRADCIFTHPPGRVLPTSFHKGLNAETPSAVLAPSSIPHNTKNKSIRFNVPSKPDVAAADAVAEAQEKIGEIAQVAEDLVETTKEVLETMEKTKDAEPAAAAAAA